MLVGIVALALIWAPGAFASTLSYSGGTLSYTAAAGQDNNVTFSEPSAGTIEVQTSDLDPITGTVPGKLHPGDRRRLHMHRRHVGVGRFRRRDQLLGR